MSFSTERVIEKIRALITTVSREDTPMPERMNAAFAAVQLIHKHSITLQGPREPYVRGETLKGTSRSVDAEVVKTKGKWFHFKNTIVINLDEGREDRLYVSSPADDWSDVIPKSQIISRPSTGGSDLTVSLTVTYWWAVRSGADLACAGEVVDGYG